MLTVHMSSIRQSTNRTSAHLIQVQSEQTVMYSEQEMDSLMKNEKHEFMDPQSQKVP